MKKPTARTVRLAVIVEGGVVQGVVADDPKALKNVEVYVVDYDAEGDVAALDIPQGDGTTQRGHVWREEVGRSSLGDLSALADQGEAA